MTESIQDEVKRSIQAAESLYHRLVLLAGKDYTATYIDQLTWGKDPAKVRIVME